MLPIAAGTLALVLVGGGVAYAKANKTVTLDVDGEVTVVSTFAGSVAGLLEDRGVTVAERDLVTPSGSLGEGAQVVVRHAHLVTVSRDGVEEGVWTTALTADEALADLAVRGGAVALVASRSGDRAQLALELTLDGPAEVLVDGGTHTVPDGAVTVADALARVDVTLAPTDRVSVQRADTGRVRVVVQRIVVQDVTTTVEVPFATQRVDDPARYRGTETVRTAGVAGVRTVVDRVTTVDGVETARVTLSDTVTQAPVDQVVAVGTKARPAVSSSPAPAVSADVNALNWAALAACESGGRVDAVSANGLYYGLYQFSLSTWRGVGGSGLPSEASADEQTARAKALYVRSGAGQWPVCGSRLFS